MSDGIRFDGTNANIVLSVEILAAVAAQVFRLNRSRPKDTRLLFSVANLKDIIAVYQESGNVAAASQATVRWDTCGQLEVTRIGETEAHVYRVDTLDNGLKSLTDATCDALAIDLLTGI